MARKEKKGDDVNPDAWLGTYADAVTLLMAFFVVLFSISSVDAQKLKELKEALQDALIGKQTVKELENLEDLKIDAKKDNNEQDKEQTEPSQGQPSETTPPPLMNKEDLKETLEEVIEQKNLADKIKLVEDERGIILQLHESLLFDSGKADLKASDEVLEALYTMINSVANFITIEGNTDNTPINTKEFPSNWELSTERAVSVARYFIDKKEISPIRITVKGFGEYNPIAENDTPENKSLNRRVDILILDDQATLDEFRPTE